eukprot:52121-Rhodomonas_salina.2
MVLVSTRVYVSPGHRVATLSVRIGQDGAICNKHAKCQTAHETSSFTRYVSIGHQVQTDANVSIKHAPKVPTDVCVTIIGHLLLCAEEEMIRGFVPGHIRPLSTCSAFSAIANADSEGLVGSPGTTYRIS